MECGVPYKRTVQRGGFHPRHFPSSTFPSSPIQGWWKRGGRDGKTGERMGKEGAWETICHSSRVCKYLSQSLFSLAFLFLLILYSSTEIAALFGQKWGEIFPPLSVLGRHHSLLPLGPWLMSRGFLPAVLSYAALQTLSLDLRLSLPPYGEGEGGEGGD